MRLWCQECGRPSSPEAKGWRLVRVDFWDDEDEDDEPRLEAYCAVCAYVEFGPSSRDHTSAD